MAETILQHHIADFLNLKRRAWQPATYQFYENMLTRFADFVGNVWPVTYTDITAWLDSTEANATSIRTYHQHLKSFFSHLEKRKLIADNPCTMVEDLGLLPPKPTLPAASLTPEEQERILAYLWQESRHSLVAQRDLVIVAFTLITGCRSTEVCQLRQSDIDLEETSAMIRVSKNHSFRTVYYNGDVRDMLAVWLGILRQYNYPGGWLFPKIIYNRHKRAHTFHKVNGLTKFSLLRTWRIQLESAGLPHKKFHALRHTAAEKALVAGVAIHHVSKQLGHSSLAVTENYLRSRDIDRQAVYREL